VVEKKFPPKNLSPDPYKGKNFLPPKSPGMSKTSKMMKNNVAQKSHVT